MKIKNKEIKENLKIYVKNRYKNNKRNSKKLNT